MKNINWNFLVGLVIIATIFSFAACSNNTETKTVEVEDTEEEYEEEESDTVGYEDLDEFEEEPETDFQNINAVDIEEKEVDSIVLVVFKERYPNATDTNWEQDANEYFVTFIENDFTIKATFEEGGGEWLQTIAEIGFEDLPIAAQTHITTKHAPEQYEHITKVDVPAEVENIVEVVYYVTFEIKE